MVMFHICYVSLPEGIQADLADTCRQFCHAHFREQLQWIAPELGGMRPQEGEGEGTCGKERTSVAIMTTEFNQGLVTVPFWIYWTSPYSSHYRPYT